MVYPRLPLRAVRRGSLCLLTSRHRHPESLRRPLAGCAPHAQWCPCRDLRDRPALNIVGDQRSRRLEPEVGCGAAWDVLGVHVELDGLSVHGDGFLRCEAAGCRLLWRRWGVGWGGLVCDEFSGFSEVGAEGFPGRCGELSIEMGFDHVGQVLPQGPVGGVVGGCAEQVDEVTRRAVFDEGLDPLRAGCGPGPRRSR